MTNEKPNRAVRFLPSLTDVAFLMPIIFLFFRMDGSKSMLGDGDTGWHVRTGEWIIAHGRVPDADFFSFSRPGQPWFAWEWLWDLMFAWLYQRAGMAAVILASIFVICLTFALLFRLVRRQSGNVIIAIGITVLAMAVSSIHWLSRPHLFTLLLIVVFLSLLERVKEGRTRLLYWMPPLTVIWTNLHGGFFVGILLVCTYAAGEFATALFFPEAEERRAALALAKKLSFTAGACMLASLVNPYFYMLHVHVFEFITHPEQLEHIIEFQTLSFHHPVAMYFEPMLLLGLAAAFWHLSKKRFAWVFLLISWAHFALMAVRNLPIFVLVAGVPVAVFLHEMLLLAPGLKVAGWVRRTARKAEQFAAEVAENDRWERAHLISAAGFVLIVALFYAPHPPKMFSSNYDPKNYPEKALEMLRPPGIAKNIFTDDEWGDYLIYRLYPGHKVFVDGRFDFYGSKFTEKYLDVMNVKYDWEQNLDSWNIDTVLLSTRAALAGALKESKRWHSVYDDQVAIVFRRDPAYPPAFGQISVASRSNISGANGKDRDRKVTKSQHGDPTITKPKPRSEPT